MTTSRCCALNDAAGAAAAIGFIVERRDITARARAEGVTTRGAGFGADAAEGCAAAAGGESAGVLRANAATTPTTNDRRPGACDMRCSYALDCNETRRLTRRTEPARASDGSGLFCRAP